MSRQLIIDKAASENGVTEKPSKSNKTKFGKWYGMDGVPWCAIFVSYIYDVAGKPLGKIDTLKGYHYCPSAYNFWKKNKCLTLSPQPGDIILYDWDGDGLSDHTGIFVKWIVEGKTFKAWEGNTSNGNNNDGGQVMIRTRSKNLVQAFVNPGVFKDILDHENEDIKEGDTGSIVANIQKMLFDLHYKIIVDGQFGNQTTSILKQFQHDHGLDQTGIADILTIGVIQSELAKPIINDKKIETGSYLKKGGCGEAVLIMQQALNKQNTSPNLSEDGVFGDSTLKCLKAFQKDKGLLQDGIAGPQVWKALGLS